MASDLPILPESTRDQDKLQAFYNICMDHFACQGGNQSPLFLRRSEHGLAIRVNGVWRVYNRNQSVEFWQEAMLAYPDLRQLNWSTKRQDELWRYFRVYAPAIKFDTRRYFEMGDCVLDTRTGDLDYSPERHLTKPTTRCSEFNYEPDYKPSPAWQDWYNTMDEYQQKIRNWSVGSAILGQHGLLFTFGTTRTGKSTLAEGLLGVLNEGAKIFGLGDSWNQFYTHRMENTTYLYDPDAKGAKKKNNANYETIHKMASGDPIQVEIKGGIAYQTTNYGFVEVISNSPTPITFESSLVDRVRFCLYTYIDPRGDGGKKKQAILADRQAWLNYAVGCAIGLAKGEIERPPIDKYQMYGWWLWLREANSYGKMCAEANRTLTYSEYSIAWGAKSLQFKVTEENVQEMKAGIRELNRQYGSKTDFLKENWDEYGDELKKDYYATKNTKLF